MAKRVFLFLATNLAIIVVLSLVVNILAAAGYIQPWGSRDLTSLAIFCLIWGMGGSFLSLQISRFIAKRSMGVQLIDGRTGDPTADWLHATVGNLARQANLPMPEVGIYDSPEVNAFATGPSKRRSLVAVSSGLLRRMRRDEVEGVLAHEISHIANGDMVTMTLLQGVLNAFVMFLARIAASIVSSALGGRDSEGRERGGSALVYMLVVFVFEIVLGVLASIITAWFSRQREFRADAGSARLAGRGNMIAALRSLGSMRELVDTAQPALASFKISGRPGFLKLFSTHPAIEERIAALEQARYL
jgi:heat shock protein HtpX